MVSGPSNWLNGGTKSPTPSDKKDRGKKPSENAPQRIGAETGGSLKSNTGKEAIQNQHKAAPRELKYAQEYQGRLAGTGQLIQKTFDQHQQLDEAHRHQGAIGRAVESAGNGLNYHNSYNNVNKRIQNSMTDASNLLWQTPDGGEKFNEGYKKVSGLKFDPNNPIVDTDKTKWGGEIADNEKSIKGYLKNQKAGTAAFGMFLVPGGYVSSGLTANAWEDNTRSDKTHDLKAGDYLKSLGIAAAGMVAGVAPGVGAATNALIRGTSEAVTGIFKGSSSAAAGVARGGAEGGSAAAGAGVRGGAEGSGYFSNVGNAIKKGWNEGWISDLNTWKEITQNPGNMFKFNPDKTPRIPTPNSKSVPTPTGNGPARGIFEGREASSLDKIPGLFDNIHRPVSNGKLFDNMPRSLFGKPTGHPNGDLNNATFGNMPRSLFGKPTGHPNGDLNSAMPRSGRTSSEGSQSSSSASNEANLPTDPIFSQGNVPFKPVQNPNGSRFVENFDTPPPLPPRPRAASGTDVPHTPRSQSPNESFYTPPRTETSPRTETPTSEPGPEPTPSWDDFQGPRFQGEQQAPRPETPPRTETPPNARNSQWDIPNGLNPQESKQFQTAMDTIFGGPGENRSAAEIRRAYRQYNLQNHPDRVRNNPNADSPNVVGAVNGRYSEITNRLDGDLNAFRQPFHQGTPPRTETPTSKPGPEPTPSWDDFQGPRFQGEQQAPRTETPLQSRPQLPATETPFVEPQHFSNSAGITPRDATFIPGRNETLPQFPEQVPAARSQSVNDIRQEAANLPGFHGSSGRSGGSEVSADGPQTSISSPLIEKSILTTPTSLNSKANPNPASEVLDEMLNTAGQSSGSNNGTPRMPGEYPESPV